jgi:hypothetical protein
MQGDTCHIDSPSLGLGYISKNIFPMGRIPACGEFESFVGDENHGGTIQATARCPSYPAGIFVQE